MRKTTVTLLSIAALVMIILAITVQAFIDRRATTQNEPIVDDRVFSLQDYNGAKRGVLLVHNDDSFLYVTFQALPNETMSVFRCTVGTSLKEICWAGPYNQSILVSRFFPYQYAGVKPVSSHTLRVPLQWAPGTTLYLSAWTSSKQGETWAYGQDSPQGVYFTYLIE